MSLAPVIVTYCTLCGLPPEFCEYNTEVAHPKAAVAVEAQLASLAVGDAAAPGTASDAAGGAEQAGEPAKAVVAKPSGKKAAKKPQVVVERATRNKRKCITSVQGLELFGVKLAEAAKKFGKKFACGASVVKDASNKEQIDVQGDCMDDLAEFIAKEFKIDLDDIKLVDLEKK